MKKAHQIQIQIFIIVFSIFSHACKKGAENTPTLPEITTKDATMIIDDGVAYCSTGGTIISNGGNPVTASGVCWSTHELPTISDLKFTTGGTPTVSDKNPTATSLGSFSCSIAPLARLTTYYFRAFATNTVGTAYGNQVSITTPCFLWINQFDITQSYPPDGMNVPSTEIKLSWIAIPRFWTGHYNFDLYLDTDSNPATKIASALFTSSFTLNELNPGTKYFWKVYGWEYEYPCNNSTSKIYNFTTP